MAGSGNRDINRNVNVKVSADIREALRSMSQLERQVDKLGDLADQGQNRQGGFLSTKQVQLFRDISKEMQKSYTDQQSKYANMQKSYAERVKKAMDDQVKYQKALERLQGGNKWGDVSSPAIIDFHQRKLAEAQKATSLIDAGPGGKSDLARMESVVKQLGDELERSKESMNRINDLHELNPRTRHQIQGLANGAITVGGITSIRSLMNYMGDGKDLIRDREAVTRQIAQKGRYDGTDNENIRDIEQTGLKNGYNSEQTMLTQATIIQGGTSDRNKSLADVGASQSFAREYSVDPSEIASSFGILRKLGTMQEGDMQRFANLIGGAIEANSMNGREEELLRSTTMLMGTVSQGMTKLSESGVGNIMSLQASLGEAVPSLRGEAGAELLGGIDTAIKAQDPNGDILLGKGSKFTGIQGYYDLEMQKAEGLSNPENLKTLLSNIQNNFVGKDYQQIVLRDWVNNRGGNMSLPQSKAFMESGLWEQVTSGKMNLTQDQLSKYGLAEQAERQKLYEGSETATRQANTAEQEIRQRNVSDEYEGASTWIMDKFNELPDAAQKGTVIGGGILGGLGGIFLGNKLRKGLGSLIMGGYKSVTGPIGGKGGNILTRLLGGAGATAAAETLGGGAAGSILGPNGSPLAEPRPTGLLGPDGKPISSAASGAAEVAETAAKGSKWWTKLAKWGKVLGPVGEVAAADGAMNTGDSLGDWFFGHSKGQPYGGTIFSPVPKHYEDDRPWIGARMWGGEEEKEPSVDEYMKEQKLKEQQMPVYDHLRNDPRISDEQARSIVSDVTSSGKQSVMENYALPEGETYGGSIPQLMGTSFAQNKAISTLDKSQALQLGMGPIDTSKVSDNLMKPWERMWSKSLDDFSREVETVAPKESEHVIRVIIDGKIEGMSSQNDTEVKDALTDYFSFPNVMNGLNLSKDQKRV
jgi:hypothetical protein